jgi:glycosyltransferase involved in cell wall biosynthesis
MERKTRSNRKSKRIRLHQQQYFFPDLKDESIHVVHNGVSSDFKPSPAKEIKKFKKENNLEQGYYLFVGSRTEYKNALTLFKAFRELPNYQDKTIICTGKKGLEPEFLTLTDGCDVRTSFFEHKKLPLLYSGADALVFPSLYEGFGLPMVEAMACGCPVISSNTGALQEVGGGAPIYIEPLDYEGFADAMYKVSSDKKLRKQMSEIGIVRASEFPWKKSAEKLQEIIMQNI